LPAVGSAIVRMPSALAMLTAADNPLALKEFVGFCPSSFIYRCPKPRLAPRRGAWTSGVMPSPSVTGVAAGMTSSYRHIEFVRAFSASRLSVCAALARSYRARSGELHFRHRFCGFE